MIFFLKCDIVCRVCGRIRLLQHMIFKLFCRYMVGSFSWNSGHPVGPLLLKEKAFDRQTQTYLLLSRELYNQQSLQLWVLHTEFFFQGKGITLERTDKLYRSGNSMTHTAEIFHLQSNGEQRPPCSTQLPKPRHMNPIQDPAVQRISDVRSKTILHISDHFKRKTSLTSVHTHFLRIHAYISSVCYYSTQSQFFSLNFNLLACEMLRFLGQLL